MVQPRPDLSELYRRAHSLIDRNKIDQADSVLDSILALQPGDVFALNKKGVISVRRGNLAAAQDYFQQAITADPMNAPGWSNLGNVSLQSGEVDLAIRQYERAITIDPDYSIAYENLSAAYRQKGDLEKSVAAMKKTKLTRKSGRFLGRIFNFLRNMGT